MVLAIALAVICLVGVIGAVIASVRDRHAPIPTIPDYDTRRPLP